MRILHELGQLDYGGVEKVVRNIIKHDTSNTHTVLAYKDGPYREAIEKAGAAVLIPNEKAEVDTDADVIHVHTGGGLSQMAMELGKNFAVVETIHSPVRSPLRDEYVKARVGVTGAVTSMNSKCETIHNGIDFEDLVPTRTRDEIRMELGIDKDAFVVGRIGRLGFDKSLEEWLLACKLLQEDMDAVPLIIGPQAANAQGYRGKLKLTAECLPVEGVIWADIKEDIANYLQAMDVFMYPSRSEGFGLVYAEAMYCGVPVVAYRNAVTEEILGKHAILVDDNVKALAEGVLEAKLRRSPERQENAKIWIVLTFSAQTMAAKYAELYERVKKLAS